MDRGAVLGGDQIAGNSGGGSRYFLQSFRLYETRSNFYLIGRDKSKTFWRVLKVDRSEPSELNISEDPTTYSESECCDLLIRINEGNMSTGGLKFVTNCYGIIGFVRFLGPYYMLLITKRRKIGAICGHVVYAITKSEIITIPNSTAHSSMAYSKDENRYKKLLCTVDLSKDFFFSYSYHVMCSLQKNFCNGETGQVLYEKMFVWNEYLTRGIRNHLKNTIWTVALVYGFFRQAKLSISGKDFKLTLIARRSRHFAGTRYLKRGVNEKGRVANDVETEQIVFEDVSEQVPVQITSVVQNRGSIPLFWSQETSWLNIKPDIILHKKDQNYEATQLHFDNLAKRYGKPIIILNLIKTREKKPRESILRSEFAKAIAYLNKDLSEENRLKFLHWDLHKHSRRKSTNVLALLGKVAAYALELTGIFYCQLKPAATLQSSPRVPIFMKDGNGSWSRDNDEARRDESGILGQGSCKDEEESSDLSQSEPAEDNAIDLENCSAKSPVFQQGVLRTNCIDCLDRTNVAQYAYGLIALGHQLYALGFTSSPKIDLDCPLAEDLMCFYERMGDTLALQYGGSAAHNKIFSERRGQWKAATQSQEFFRAIHRHYSNTYMDAEKQDAINVFLGYFQPQKGKPALWELGSDQHYNAAKLSHAFTEKNTRSLIKRSLSDGNILDESPTPISSCPSHARVHQLEDKKNLSEPSAEISNDSCILNSRHTSKISGCGEHLLDEFNHSNFLDLDWLSSSGCSMEDEIYDRSSIISSPVENLSTENVIDGLTEESTPALSEKGSDVTDLEPCFNSAESSNSLHEFPDTFARWVAHGSMLCH